MPEESLVEHATQSTSSAAGVDSIYSGTSSRTPSRSFHYRSLNRDAGGYYPSDVNL